MKGCHNNLILSAYDDIDLLWCDRLVLGLAQLGGVATNDSWIFRKYTIFHIFSGNSSLIATSIVLKTASFI